ncbi:glycerophosphodiester phosphodiesterase [Roseibium marinum]|uniref:Glycerophosphoryl diester phosphodiesterase n=1 Tax=Roseibium marinum TaxID=281252 RepID=A0A2S3V2Z7_9HYPH|nr:glycerophosphodiester phosphodiesterase family protein [Roseibium marinum]POF34153.1 glycerophosphoryl diester phosphodiesterase [Roseibium marinum]
MTQFGPDRTWIHDTHRPPLAIAHRGASAYAFDNTMRAFEVARELGADMWEVDVRLTADGVPVAFHDADLKAACGRDLRLSDVTAAVLADLTAAAGRSAPLFADIAALAARAGAGIYLDAKEGEAASRAVDILLDNRIARAIVGANTPDYCAELLAAGCPYPVSILVGLGGDPFEIADRCGAQIVHPCWERAGDRPDALLDDAFFAKARERGLPVVTWHEERTDVVEALVKMPVLGICSDQPEMVARYKSAGLRRPEIVCHRGACGIAPENTKSAARAAWAAGFDSVEIDVRETSDGELVVHHDPLLERTTSGAGELAEKTLAEIAALDAGSWFDPFFNDEPVPLLAEIVDMAFGAGGKLYVELKQADPVRTVQAVLKRMAPEDVFFWSANVDWLHLIRETFPQAMLMARPEDFDSLDTCLAAFEADIIEFNRRNANAAGFETVRRAGRKVMVAYMGSDTAEMERLLGLQPDLVNVNEPFQVARLLAGKEDNGSMDVRRIRA